MPSFTINVPPGDPPVLQGGKGTIAFTVTNTATRTVDGTVLVKPDPPAVADWFTFAGGATRTFGPGAVESVGVNVAAPVGKTAATYTFRLDAKAEDNPDEDYTEGPTVQFSVPGEVKPPPWWKRYWWIGAIAAVVLIAIVIAVVLLSGDDANGSGGTGTPTPEPAAGVPEFNCESYDPESVEVVRDGGGLLGDFAVTADRRNLAVMATAADADLVKQVARAHTKLCGVGTVEYWLGEGTDPRPALPDCVDYDPSRLDAFEVRGRGTQLLADGTSIAIVSGVDKRQLLAVARSFKRHCLIGDRRTADRREQTVDYWE